MNRFVLVLFVVLTNFLQGDEGESPPWHWSNVDLTIFSTRSPDRLASAFNRLKEQRPPDEIMDEALDRLARNKEFREWLVDYYEETPVTWENYGKRSSPLWVLQYLRAEWVIRFLMELHDDKRPMTSSKYDYDSSEFVESLKEYARSHPNEAEDYIRRTGYNVSGRNCDLASARLCQIPLSGAPTLYEMQTRKQWMKDWLLAPNQRDRLPEILSETWGEKAVLNAELGLGPDNKPLGEGSGSTSGQSGERRPMAERLGGGEVEIGEKDGGTFIPWLPLGGALLVLSAGAVVWLRSRSKAA